MRLIDADALKAKWYKINDIDENDRGARFVGYTEIARLIDEAPTIEPSEQYKKGFEDAKRAFELEYARESENMRKRNAELEVMLNAYRVTSAEPSKSAEQNVADVPIGDTISRADAVDVVHKYFVEALDNEPHEIDEDGDDVFTDMKSVNALLHHNKYVSKALKALPSANRPTENFCRDCPIYSADRPKVNSDSAEEQIAETEQKSNRPKGDPETEPASVVAYICDRRRCAICNGPEGGCDHTTDIKHAAHFKNVAGQYFERPYMEEDDG